MKYIKYSTDTDSFMVPKHLSIPDKSFSFKILEINQQYSILQGRFWLTEK